MITTAAEVERLTKLASADRGDAPGSRYGRWHTSYVPFAVAGQLVMADSNGVEDDESERESLDYIIGLVVNDSASVADIIANGWHVIPRALRQELGGLRHVRALAAE